MRILVTAARGNIGRRVVRELLAPEFSVRVIARDPARLPEEILEQVEVVRGSADDATAMRRALDGVEALFWCVPPESTQETNVPGHYERFAQAGCKAIREAQTPRVVTISAIGKGVARNAGPISGLHAMEDILNESGAAIRHLRCGLFMENFLRQLQPIRRHGLFSHPLPGQVRIPMVAASDIADVALRLLARRNWKGIEAVPVHGPADISYEQAAGVLERILDRPVQYREASADQFVQALVRSGASIDYARSLVEMFVELAEGIARAEPRTAASTTRTTLAAWTASELLPLFEVPGSKAETACAWACNA
jgi:uncharacterized protein YbjT (DUF2867 family)